MDPGRSLAGTYMLFTSAAVCDYWVLKFDASGRIVAYRIYSVPKRNFFYEEITGFEPKSLLVELDGSLLEYWHRKINEDVEIEYVLTAVDDRGNESLFAHAKAK